MKEDKHEFTPHIPAEEAPRELTNAALILGIIIAIVFGAANAYLGLRIGMTISASIPAAVISMALLRGLFGRNSVLENNIVQSIGSAGESLAAGVIFTVPALFLWAKEGKTEMPDIFTIAVIAVCGGILGVLFMIPLRNILIVKEHNKLIFPEGVACTEVLLAGNDIKKSGKKIFAGFTVSALVKFVIDGIKLIPCDLFFAFKSFGGALAASVYPALIGVGYLVGIRTCSYLLAGSVISFMILCPLFVLLGGEAVIHPGKVIIAQIYQESGVYGIWSNYIRYIGAGAIATAGIFSLFKSLPMIFSSFRTSFQEARKGGLAGGVKRTEQDLPAAVIAGGIFVVFLLLWLLPHIPVNFFGAVIICVFSFFFVTVSSRIVGMIGSSNNPVSGMCIATLLIAATVLQAAGVGGIKGMCGSIAIGSVVCVACAIAGDISQDLKTGFYLGSTPKLQQIGEVIGVIASGIAIGGVVYLLDSAWGFGSRELAAPQATLMKILVEGIMEGNLPWNLVFIGAMFSVCFELLGVSAVPIAIGIYLPIEIQGGLIMGALVRWLMEHRPGVTEEDRQAEYKNGSIFSAGLVAGEGMVGLLLAGFAISGVDIAAAGADFGMAGSVAVLLLVMGCLTKFALK